MVSMRGGKLQNLYAPVRSRPAPPIFPTFQIDTLAGVISLLFHEVSMAVGCVLALITVLFMLPMRVLRTI